MLHGHFNGLAMTIKDYGLDRINATNMWHRSRSGGPNCMEHMTINMAGRLLSLAAADPYKA